MNNLAKEIKKVGLKNGLLAELEDIYRDLDEQIEQLEVGCEQCGRCCGFAQYGQQLMVSTAEAGYFLAWLGRQAPAVIRLLEDKAEHAAKVCPFLKDDTCAAREARLLGCRVFFCKAKGTKQQGMENIYEVYHERLKTLHEKYGVKYYYLPWGQTLSTVSEVLGRIRLEEHETRIAG